MPGKNDRIAVACGLTLLLAASFGCAEKKVPPPAKAGTPAVARPPVQKKSSSAASPAPRERFDFSGRRDPFRSYLAASKAKLPLPQLSQSRLPIQQFEVSQFKVLGIVTGLQENRAMVLDPASKSYVIRQGAYIGPHIGRVRSITLAGIEVAEQYRDESGSIRQRVVKLTTLQLPCHTLPRGGSRQATCRGADASGNRCVSRQRGTARRRQTSALG